LTAQNAGGQDTESKQDYISVLPNIDLTISGMVTTIPSTAIFAREPNTVSVNSVKNLGTATATNIVVALYASDVNGGLTPIATTTIPSLAGGGTTTISLTDPTIRNLDGGTVTYTAKLDPDNLIAESNESNNEKSGTAIPLVYNGYKGKTYWDGMNNITTKKTYDLQGGIVYSTQPTSAYKAVGWTTRDETWSASDFSAIPAGATIEDAWLYISYNWDTTPGGVPSISATFNGNPLTLGTPYTDQSNFGSYASYKYGLYPAINVTSYFSPSGNTLVMTANAGNSNALYPSTLLVIYRDGASPRRQIFINEEIDLLATSSESYGTTLEEATAYVPFDGMTIDTGSVQSATLHGFATNAGPNEGHLIFNGVTVATGAWQGSANSVSAQTFDVTGYLAATGNEAAIQGNQSGGMCAIQQILVVEHSTAPPIAAFSATPRNGPVPLKVVFSDTSSGTITDRSWAYKLHSDSVWTPFTLDGENSFTFTTAGIYDINLTVSGPGGSNTSTESGYITAYDAPPVAAFSATPRNGPVPLKVV
ncbi:MAG: DUF3344 domain-containing protein, partial [Methanolinea tarda]